MNSTEFVEELERSNSEALERVGSPDHADSAMKADIPGLLRIAMKNEWEAFELAAHWIPSTPELDVKLGLARQVGDEAKHYRLLEARLRELDEDPVAFDPREKGYSPLFQYLAGLASSVERLAAGQFTREAIAQRRNDMFIEYLLRSEDEDTARIYRDIIQPDEAFHHELGKTMLLKYATTTHVQIAAREACRRTLEIAEILRKGAIDHTGVYQIPGC